MGLSVYIFIDLSDTVDHSTPHTSLEDMLWYDECNKLVPCSFCLSGFGAGVFLV